MKKGQLGNENTWQLASGHSSWICEIRVCDKISEVISSSDIVWFLVLLLLWDSLYMHFLCSCSGSSMVCYGGSKFAPKCQIPWAGIPGSASHPLSDLKPAAELFILFTRCVHILGITILTSELLCRLRPVLFIDKLHIRISILGTEQVLSRG